MKIGLISLHKGSGCPPIGLVYIATYIKKHRPDIRVEIFDANYTKDLTLCDIYGIGAMTIYYEQAKQMGMMIRKMLGKPVIIGGVHITTCPKSMDYRAFDSMVIGEGEQAWLEIIKDYENDKIKPRYKFPMIENLDDLPRPNWNFVDRRYFNRTFNTTFAEYGVSGVMLTSRGCPYNCVFCSTKSFWGNKVRFHSAEYVKGLIQDLDVRGVTHIQIWDDLFTINKERLKQISIGSKKKIKFNCQPRTDLLDDEMCKLLKDIGVTICIFGFESGSNKVLKYLKKDTTTVETNKRAIRLCRKHGLKVQGSVMLGSPGETLDDMRKTIWFVVWAILHGVQRIWSFVATPFPATEWWDDQEVDSCSHHNIDNPMLASVPKKEFKKVMVFLQRIETVFKIKKGVALVKAFSCNTLLSRTKRKGNSQRIKRLRY